MTKRKKNKTKEQVEVVKPKGAGAPFANPAGVPTDMPKQEKMDPEVLAKELENGDVLVNLRNYFITQKTPENLMPLLKCMKDSQIIVPMNLELSEEDLNRFENAEDGERMETSDEIKMLPAILEAKGKRLFPMFSQVEQIPEDFKNDHNLVKMPTVQALNMAHAIKDLDGIVLDPLTAPVAMPFVTADMIYITEGL